MANSEGMTPAEKKRGLQQFLRQAEQDGENSTLRAYLDKLYTRRAAESMMSAVRALIRHRMEVDAADDQQKNVREFVKVVRHHINAIKLPGG